MTIKNSKISYVFIGIIFAVIWGIYMSFSMDWSIEQTLIPALIAGLVFGLFLGFLADYIQGKSKYLTDEVSKKRKVICDGAANYKNGINVIGGWLILSEDAIEFYSHKLNFGSKNIPIPLDDIENVSSKANNLIIKTKEKKFTFVVSKSKVWEKNIKETL